MIGVVVPAHDEEALLGACLASIALACAHPALAGEAVAVYVVLDRCRDRSATIAATAGACCLPIDAGCVGAARAHGVDRAIADGARWIATTDADSTVPPDWIAGQLATGADLFCGMVEVMDWQAYAVDTSSAWQLRHRPCDDHPHVHGANLGFDARAYLRSGGFQCLPAHEDVALVEAMRAAGASIASRATPRVVTSARRDGRAIEGFAGYLRRLEVDVASGWQDLQQAAMLRDAAA